MISTSRIKLFPLAPTALLLLALGGGAGFINGLLGTGGGILLVLALRIYVRRHAGEASAEAQRDIFATALSVMVPISVLSTFLYARAGTLELGGFAPMILPTVIGGLLGAWLLDRLRLDILKRLFSLLLIVSGVLMVIRS